MRTSVVSTFLTLGILAGAGMTSFADEGPKHREKDDRKEHKQSHKEQSKEHKERHKDQRGDRDHHWNTGEHRQGDGRFSDRRHYSDRRGHGDWQWQRRGDNDRYHDSQRRHYGSDRDHYGSDRYPDRDRKEYSRWNSDRSDRDREWTRHEGHDQDRNKDYGQNHRDRDAVGFSRPLAATTKISFDQLPNAVKRTVEQQAKGAPIEDVERGTLDGRTVYEVAFKENGVHNELRVYEDGDILRRIAGNNIQFPGTLRLSEVPTPVQQTIRQRIGSAEINDIDRMNVQGQVVYEVGFKRDDGVQREMQISESGAVINEAAGAEAHR